MGLYVGCHPRGEGRRHLGDRKQGLRRRVKDRLKRAGAWAIALSYQVHLWCVWRTGRVEVIGCDRLVEAFRRHDRVSIALWHENLVMAIYAMRECRPTTLASKSDIGDVIAAILERQDYHVFRGGTSRGKARRSPALDAMVDYFRTHRDVLLAITVDGSAGPARKMKPGIVALSAQAQSPTFAVHCVCRPCLRLWTWDKTRVPIAFSRVVVLLEGPLPPEPEGRAGFRKMRDQTDLLLRDVCRRAEAYFETGELPPTDPALGLDPSYGADDTRRGATLFGKGAPPINPRPMDAAP